MKNKRFNIILVIILLSFIFYSVHTFALMRKGTNGSGSLDAATWSVSRNYSQSGDSLEVYAGGETDSYSLTVQSNSEVDVKYKIIIDNLPVGVEVDIDNTGYLTPTDGVLTIENNNTVINYNDAVKTKTHVLTFRAAAGSTLVDNQEIDIDVEFRQDV